MIHRSIHGVAGLLAPSLLAAACLGIVPVSAAASATEAIIPVPLKQVIAAPQRVCTATSASGVGTRVLKPGAAEHPDESDVVLVNYIGYLAADGAVFDQGAQATFPVDGVIKGFAEGIRTMGRGGITRICVPAALGYGAKGTGPIPANADLVFQVELVDFKSAAEVSAMQRQMQDNSPQ